MNRNAFHLVELSPWPITSSISALCLTMGLVSWMHGYPIILMQISFMVLMISMYQWWRDVTREATFEGAHMMYVKSGLSIGMILFITSEICFFFSFFWAYFHMSYLPAIELGSKWPPIGIEILNPFSVPLLNTMVLLASGVTITWAHHSLINNDKMNLTMGLIMTIILGTYFTILQLNEYKSATFSISDSVYGTTFFVTTGFHGAHVLIGSSFLLICLIRSMIAQYSSNHHFGFIAAVWYWHFVDVVWICLFISMYWWGS
nr:TPA: cytochrome c oxidase subunit III [Holtodrilus truncatus]